VEEKQNETPPPKCKAEEIAGDASSPKPLGKWLVAAAIFLAFFALYSRNLRETSGWIYALNDRIFFADTRDSYHYIKHFSFGGDMRKHPLFAVLANPLHQFFQDAFGLNNRRAAHCVLAGFGALCVTLFYLLLRERLAGRRAAAAALLWALLYGVSFANIVFFCIPETYGLTNACVAAFFLVAAKWNKTPLTRWRALLLGGLAGVGALANPPLGMMTAAVFVWGFERGSRRDSESGRWRELWRGPWRNQWRGQLREWLWKGAAASLAAIGVFLGANLFIYGEAFFTFSKSYTNKWASPANFLHIHNWLNVFVSFLVFNLVSPLKTLKSSIGAANLAGYWANPAAGALAALWIGYLACAAVWAVRRAGRFLVGVAVWAGALMLFYLYFNPKEAFLYSSQILLPLLWISAEAWEHLTRQNPPSEPVNAKTLPPKGKFAVFHSPAFANVLLGLFLLASAFINLRCFLTFIHIFGLVVKVWCCACW